LKRIFWYLASIKTGCKSP